MWPSDEITKEVVLYQKLKAHGVPLPALLGCETQIDDIGRMKEESLKWKLYAELFAEQYEKNGTVWTDLLSAFIAYQMRHLDAQQRIINDTTIIDSQFDKTPYLYSEWFLSHELIDRMQKQLNTDLATLPQAWNHGDHNPYNIFEDGIIDLEDWFFGPVWYDSITALTQNFWFPRAGEEGELTRQFMFTHEQLLSAFTELTTHSLGINFTDSRIFGALFLLRWIFVTVKSNATPILETYRYKKMQKAIEAYLQGEHMLEYFLKHY